MLIIMLRWLIETRVSVGRSMDSLSFVLQIVCVWTIMIIGSICLWRKFDIFEKKFIHENCFEFKARHSSTSFIFIQISNLSFKSIASATSIPIPNSRHPFQAFKNSWLNPTRKYKALFKACFKYSSLTLFSRGILSL